MGKAGGVSNSNVVGLNIRHCQVVLVTLAATALAGCGEGYRLDSACLNVIGITGESKDQLLILVSRFLKREGFEDLGKYEQMALRCRS